MATKVLLSSNGSQGSSSKGRRLERRARRERCRTQVYEGQEQRPPLEEAAASSDQSQRSLRPRHKSCDSKVDLKSKRRSYPEQQQTDTESDSPAEDSRRMARRPRRSRGDNSSRTNESGHSSGNQPNRNSVSSQKNLNVPVNPLTCQPSSDSALYSSQRAPQGNVSSNGSRSKFQQLEQRRRQRLDMTVTSDEEAVDYPGTPPSSTKMKTQKTYANGKPQDVSSQQPQFGFTHNYNPASFNNETQQSYLVGHVPTFPRESQLDNSEELMTKKPVSQLKAQFENQMQQSSSTQSPNKVANVSSSGPVSRTFNPNSLEPKRLSSGAVNALDPVPVKGSRWQTSGQTQPPAVSIKPLKSQPVHLSRPVGQLYQPLSDEQSTVSKNRSYNDADSLDELLESNKDYLGQALGNSDEKAAVKANIKQTMKTLQSQSASVKPNTEPGAVFSRRRTSDPTLRREAVPQTFVRNGRQSFATNTSEMFTAKITASPSGSTSIQGPQTLAKPVWPRNILSSLSPEIACQAATNNEPVQSALSPVVSPPAATPQHKQSSSARPSLRSPSSDTLEDLWIPRRSEPEHSQSAPKNHGDGRQARRSEIKNGSTSTRVDKDLAVSSPPKKPERTFVYNTPVMVVTEDKSQPHANAVVTSSGPNENVCSPDGLSVPLGADGMFSDVDYNIEVSERVKKWEFLMHEKNMPARKDQIPDKVNLFELDEMGVLLSPRSRLSVIDEKSEAKNVFGFPSASPVGKTGSGVVTNSGGDLMLSENQMWTYPGSSQTKPSPPKATTGPQESVRQHRDVAFGGEAWYSDWYFKGYAKDMKSPATEHKHLKDSKPTELSPAPSSQKMRNASSYGSSPTMTRKIVYEPVKPDSEQPRLNLFFAPSSDSEITNPLYTPVKVRLEPVISTKKSVPLKSSQSGHLSASAVHRRQDSDEQIWKEIERMTLYARAIAGAASSASESRSEAVPSHQVQKSPTRRSAYEPLISENASADLFVPLSVDVSSPKRNQRSRPSNPLDNVPLVASAKTYKPKNPAKITTRSFQYHHIPVTDKYQRPEALDDVLEEIASSRERKPFSPKNKSPGLSSSSQWSTGTPDKPPLSPDIISITSNQQMYRGNDSTGGRPSSMTFPVKNSSYYPQQTTDSNKRETERKYAEKQTRFMNLAHGKEYQLDHNLLKQKLLGTGLVEESALSPTYIAAPRFRESQPAESGSGKAVDSDSGSQHSMTHVNNAIKELRHLAQDVESRINMIKTRLVTTKEEDLDTVLMTLRRCSSNLASAKSGHVGSSASAKSRKTKLNDALSELEKIYESLDLNSDPSANTKREYPPSQGSQWSITSMTDISSLGSYTHSGSEVHTDANLSDYNMRWQSSDFARREKKRKLYSNDGLDQLTRALESSGYSNSSSDPWQSVRRDQDGEETPRALNIFNFTTTAPASHDNLPNQRFQVQVETKPITADHYYTPTESLSALSSEKSNRRTRSRKQEVDLTDDGSYRKIRTKSATRGDTDSPNVSASSTDYLSQHCRPEARSRQQTRPEKDTVQYHNSYTNSRYDGIIDNPKPPPRSSSLHRKGQRNRTDESDSDPQHVCNAETQTCHLDEGDSSGAENRGLGHKRQGRSKEKSQSSRKLSKEKRRRSFGRGVAKMVERFSSSEDERPRRRLQHSRSAPDLTDTHYSDTYNSKGEIISTETDTNKEDEAPLQNGKKKSKDNKAIANNKSSTKSQTPRTVKQRNEAKSRIRNNLQNTADSKNTKQSRIVNGNSKIQNKTVLKAKAMENFVSSSDQTPLGSSCEGSPASARLLIHRQTKRVPLATISTTSTSGEESASGSKTSLNQTMALPQGSVVRRQTPADLPSGSGVKLRKTKPSVTKAERKERSKSVPELCARFETDPTRLKSILGSLRKSISAGNGTIESFEKAKKLPFCSEPNLRDNRISGRVINKGKRWR